MIFLQVVPTPLVKRDSDAPMRQIDVHVQISETVESAAIVLNDGREPIRLDVGTLSPGAHSFSVDIPEVHAATVLRADLMAHDECLCTEEVALSPAKPWTVYLLHQSHFDIGYTDLQREIYTLQQRNLDQVLEYIEDTREEREDDQFRWTVECTFPLLQYFENRPAARVNRFIQRVQEGKIEVAAGLFNLHGEFCSTEELVRSFYPVAALRKLGIAVRTAIQTDIPGAPAILPRILNNIGVRYLAMAPNNHRAPFHKLRGDRLPRPFYWSSGYGDRVLTWFTDLMHNYQEGNILGFLQSVDVVEERLPARLLQLEQDGFAYDVLGLRIQGSYSDNGLPNLRIAEVVKEWNAQYRSPTIRNATFGEWMALLEARYGGQVPVVTGEWPDWWADGVGSAARELAMIRRTQDQALHAQTMHALVTTGTSDAYPARRIDRVWQNILLSDEHTWGAARPTENRLRGPASGELQWGVKKSFFYMADLEANELEEASSQHVGVRAARYGETTVVVINSLSRRRTDVVRVALNEVRRYLPGSTNWILTDAVTEWPVAYQVVRDDVTGQEEIVFIASDVPAMGYRTFRIESAQGSPQATECTQVERRVWNPKLDNAFFTVEVCPTSGALLRVYDKQRGRELVARDHRPGLNQLVYQAIESRHGYFIDQAVTGQSTDAGAHVQKVEKGPVLDRLVVTAQCGELRVHKDVRIYHALDRIDVTDRVDKPHVETKEALYLALPFDVEGGRVRIETAGGWITPGIDVVPGSCTDWFVARKYVDVSNDDWGVTVALVDTPMIAWGDIRQPSVRDHAGDTCHDLYVYVQNNLWSTNFPHAQGGELALSYSISVHGAPFDPVFAETCGAQTLTPLRAVVVGEHGGVMEGQASAAQLSWMEVSGDDSIIVSAVSRSEQALVFRAEEIAGRRGTATVRFPQWQMEAVSETNLIEEELRDIVVDGMGIEIELRPKEVRTFKVVLH